MCTCQYQNSKLKAKIRQLEEQIVERTRNYLTHSARNKKYKVAHMEDIQIQTGPELLFFLTNTQEIILSRSPDSKVPMSLAPLKQVFGGEKEGENWKWDVNLSGDSLKLVGRDEECQKLKQQILILQQRMGDQEIQNWAFKKQNNSHDLEIKKLTHKISELEEDRGKNISDLEQILLQARLIQNKLEECLQENRRLKNELSRVQERNEKEKGHSNEEKCEIQKLKLVSKEYVKAYAKIKERNSELESKVQELEEELMETSRKKNRKHGRNLSSANTADSFLTVIAEHNDEEIEDLIRQSSNDSSINTVIRFLEKSLQAENRLAMQKWISSSTLKLRELEKEIDQKRILEIFAEKIMILVSQICPSIDFKVPSCDREVEHCCQTLAKHFKF